MLTTAPLLTTERLLIAPATMEHWEAYAAAWADPRLTEFVGGQPRSRNESWMKFLQGLAFWQVLGYGFWVFLDKETGQFLGNGGLAQFERGIPELEGYPESGWVFTPEAWGKGYATETMSAIFDWADKELCNPEIRCIIDPGNVASQRVAAKLGFSEIGFNEAALGHPVHIYARGPSAS